ncbi:MAG: hypothetical protein H7Y86_04320 [Rhizobacter sp.]|nr:hypothetical protein [Ferruginibacter sp.]
MIALETTIVDISTLMAIEVSAGAKNHTKISRNSPAVNLMYVVNGCFVRFKRKYGVVKTIITARIKKISFSVMLQKFW